ncbi:MAG: tyrosine-protein phosphatase, partial [Bacteroidota bacterium]
LMSNYYLHENMEKRVRQAAIFYGIDRDNLRMLMNVDESYLEAAFSTIEKKYGSTEQFFRQALNVSDTDIEYLKEKLLYGYSPELD